MSLNLIWFSMQDQCNKVTAVEQATNKATEDKAAEDNATKTNATLRFRRHGQVREQTVTRYMMSMTAMLTARWLCGAS